MCSVYSLNAIFDHKTELRSTVHAAAGVRHFDAHLHPLLGGRQHDLRRVGDHAHVGAAWMQVMHLPAEDLFDAETDEVTVGQPVERNAEPQAFLILVKPVSGKSSDVDYILGGVENLVAPGGPLLHHLLDGVFARRGRGFGQGASGAGFPRHLRLAFEGLDLHHEIADGSTDVPGGRADSFRTPALQRLG